MHRVERERQQAGEHGETGGAGRTKPARDQHRANDQHENEVEWPRSEAEDRHAHYDQRHRRDRGQRRNGPDGAILPPAPQNDPDQVGEQRANEPGEKGRGSRAEIDVTVCRRSDCDKHRRRHDCRQNGTAAPTPNECAVDVVGKQLVENRPGRDVEREQLVVERERQQRQVGHEYRTELPRVARARGEYRHAQHRPDQHRRPDPPVARHEEPGGTEPLGKSRLVSPRHHVTAEHEEEIDREVALAEPSGIAAEHRVDVQREHAQRGNPAQRVEAVEPRRGHPIIRSMNQ